MKIELYKKEKHGDILQEMLFNDKEAGDFIGEIGLHEPAGSCSFWNYRVVMIEKDKIIGFAKFGEVDSLNKTAQLSQLYVSKESRKKGVGKQLLFSGLEYYKNFGLKILKLTVLECNPKAIEFYRSCGFKRCGYCDYGMIHKGEIKKTLYFAKVITG